MSRARLLLLLAGGRVPSTGDLAPEPFLGAGRFGPRHRPIAEETSA
jgi:hypothetical protein